MPTAYPKQPTWQPGRAPAGCKFYAIPAAGAGTRVLDYRTPGWRLGSFTGTPAWQRGPYGWQLSFPSGSGVEFNGTPIPGYGTTFPSWIGCMAAPTGSGGVIVSHGWTGADTSWSMLQCAATTANYTIHGGDLSGEAVAAATGLSVVDGRHHVFLGVSYSLTDHRFYFDGVQVATSTTAIVAFGGPGTHRLSIGYLGTTGNYGPYTGAVSWFGMGAGSVPDPRALAADLLSGTFAAVRPRSTLVMTAAAMAPRVAPLASILNRRRAS